MGPPPDADSQRTDDDRGMTNQPHVPLKSDREILVELLNGLRQAMSLIDVHIAAGIAAAALLGEPEPCLLDCKCSACAAFDAARAA